MQVYVLRSKANQSIDQWSPLEALSNATKHIDAKNNRLQSGLKLSAVKILKYEFFEKKRKNKTLEK